MFTIPQLEAISAAALKKADWYASAPEPRSPAYAVEYSRQNRKRIVSELRWISSDALFLIDVPDCENTLASLDQALNAWPELDTVCEIAARSLAA